MINPNRLKKLSFLVIATLLVFTILAVMQRRKPANKAVLLWKTGDREKAMEIWRNGIQTGRDPVNWQKLAEAYLNIGDYTSAEELSMKALTYFPDCVNFYFYIGMSKYYKKNYEDSLKYAEKVIAANPYFPEVYLLKGMNYLGLGKPELARIEFVEELNNNPGNRLAWKKLRELNHEKN